jgi:acetyl esterase/lipase
MPFRAFRSPLAAFNRLVPKDRGGLLAAAGRPFGDHPRQRLDFYVPRRPGKERVPIILFFYGFLTAVPDYRLVPEGRFPAFVEDGAAAVRWARRHAAGFGGDPERIVLIGHSAGAHIGALLALDPQWLGEDRPALRGFVGLAGPYDFLPLEGPVTRAAFGHWADPAVTQPVNFAAAGAPPVLLLHGGRDRTVRPRNSLELARRLAAAGGEAQVRIYPTLGHVDLLTALALPLRRRAPVLADAVAFAADAAAS